METPTLEDRIARLESVFGEKPPELELSPRQTLISLALALISIAVGVRGFGVPNHPYQAAGALLALLLAYHRGWLRKPKGWRIGPLFLCNALQLMLVFKLFIGSGRRYPFFWLKYPTLVSPDAANKSWYEVVPKWSMAWEPTALTLWDVDFTVMQTFLVIVTLIGALFRFQPFVSLTALALIFASVPAFLDFQWQWVFPSLATSAICLYVQSDVQ